MAFQISAMINVQGGLPSYLRNGNST